MVQIESYISKNVHCLTWSGFLMIRDPTKSLKHFRPFSYIELNLLFTDGDKNHFPLIEPKCPFDCSLKFKLKFRENNWTVINCY